MSVEVTATGSPTSVSVSSNTISASVSTGQGPAGTVTVGTVTTGAPGSSASVVNVGTPTNAVLNFTIPAGADGEGGGGSVAWADITGKPSTFTPATHTHSISDVTSLQTTLDGKASSSHSHAISDVSGLQTALDGKQVSGSYAASSHTHGNLTNDGKIGSTADRLVVTGSAGALTTAIIGSGLSLSGGTLTASGGGSPAWADITSKPTTVSGFGITDAVTTSDARLTDSREWSASTVSQADAEAGTATARVAWTVQRVWQAIAAWWAASAAKTKLDGIATGATANATDAQLRDRSTHTGTQAWSTITSTPTTLAGYGITDAAASSHSHSASDITSGTLEIARIPTGTSSSTVCIGNDARLSDARTPSAHAASHGVGGADALSLLATQVETGTDTAYFNADESVQTALTELSTAVSGKAATSHSHSGSDITSGTVGTARLGSGTANSTTFLRGDGTWATPSGGGSSSSSYSSVLLFG